MTDDPPDKFIDLPEKFFPISLKWTDIDTGEVIREYTLAGPGVLGDGGFGIGRRLRMEIKLGTGEEMVMITDGRI